MKKLTFLLAALLICSAAVGQSVAITDDANYSPDSSAMLDVKSNNKGILIPRLDSIQRTSISDPATGLLVFQTDGTAGFYYYTGSGWIMLSTTLITQLADADGDTKVEVEESADEDRIRFDVNGSEAMIIDTDGNIGIGTSTPTEELTINGDIKFASGDGNIFASSSSQSIFIGKNASGHDSPFSSWLIADGYVQLSVDGGTDKGIRINDAGYVGVGTNSPSDKFHVQGTDNVSAKIIAGSADTSSLKLFESGDYGFEFQYDGSNDKLDLWSRKYLGKEDIRMTWLKNGNVGIGTTSPDETLHVVGNIKITDSNQEEGKLLVSDANGKGQWQNLSPLSIFGDSLSQPDFSCLSVKAKLGLGEFPISVDISGNYAYVVDIELGDFKVIDISNPTSPNLIGGLLLGQWPVSVVASNNYAYVIDRGSDDLKIIDISNPTNPEVLGDLGIGSWPESLAISGNYAYVVDQISDDLRIIDVSNPSNPELSGSLGIGKTPKSIAVSGNYSYIVDHYSQDLKIIDVSNPENPFLAGSLDIGAEPNDIVISGNLAYVVDGNSDDLKIINISNPASPTLLSSLGIGGWPMSIAVSGSYAYVTDVNTYDLKIIDVSNPTGPLLSDSLGLGNYSTSVAVSGNYAFTIDGDSDDFTVIQISCYNNVSVDLLTGKFTQTAINTSEIHDADEDTRIQVEDSLDEDVIKLIIRDSTRMVMDTSGKVGIGTIIPDEKLHVVGNIKMTDGNQEEGKLLVSDANGKGQWQNLNPISIFGDSLPEPDFSCLFTKGSLLLTGGVVSVAVSGNYAYVVSYISDDLKVIDVSNPAIPILSGSLGIGGWPSSIAVSGNYAYVIDGDSEDLKVIDISNPDSPVLSSSMVIGSSPSSIAVSGNYAYVTDLSSNDLKVIDVSDPASPVLAGSLGIGTYPYSVAVSGNYAYVVDYGSDDLKVIDVSDPAGPVLTGSLGIGTYPISVAVSGNYAYVVDYGSDDLKVIDVSNPASPSLSGSLGIGDPISIAVSGNYAYVCDSQNGDLKVIDVNNPTNPALSGSLGIGSFPKSIAVSDNYAYVLDGISQDIKIIQLSCYNNVSIDPFTGSFIQNREITKCIRDADNDTQIMVEESADDDIIRAIVRDTLRMSIDNNGYIGIGTDTPSDKLHLHGTDNVSLKITAGNADTSSLKLFEANDYGFEFQYDGSNDRLYLWSRKYTGNEDIRMTWYKNGDVKINNLGSNTVYSNNGILSNSASSDRRLKENITPFSPSLDKVMQLRPVTFDWKESGQQGIGFIAQEVETVIPELVGENADGYKGIYTTEMIPYLVKAMQEQQEMIRELQKQNMELMEKLSNLEKP